MDTKMKAAIKKALKLLEHANIELFPHPINRTALVDAIRELQFKLDYQAKLDAELRRK